MAEDVQALIRHGHDMIAKLLMLIQWRAGLRISEALALEVKDLDLADERPVLRVRQGKGNQDRMVPCHPELRVALENAISFGKTRGRFIPVTRNTAHVWIKNALARAQGAGQIPLGKQVSTHTLRHSAARHWLANGVQINVVQRWLGHASLQTTLIYLEILPDPRGDMERVP